MNTNNRVKTPDFFTPHYWKESKIILPVCGASRYEDAGSDQNLFQIVNGWEARIHEFPWQVTSLSGNGTLFTMGTAIKRNRTKEPAAGFRIWLSDWKYSYSVVAAPSTYALYFKTIYDKKIPPTWTQEIYRPPCIKSLG